MKRYYEDTLPVAPTPPGGIRSVGGRSGRLLILVVERDPHVRELEAHFLDEAGFAVEFARDGEHAFERAQVLMPDVMVTEILVPKVDGLALCRRIKTDPRTRGILVCVFSILAAHGRAEAAGADAFLLKPLAEHRLLSTVQQLLERKRSLVGDQRA